MITTNPCLANSWVNEGFVCFMIVCLFFVFVTWFLLIDNHENSEVNQWFDDHENSWKSNQSADKIVWFFGSFLEAINHQTRAPFLTWALTLFVHMLVNVFSLNFFFLVCAFWKLARLPLMTRERHKSKKCFFDWFIDLFCVWLSFDFDQRLIDWFD